MYGMAGNWEWLRCLTLLRRIALIVWLIDCSLPLNSGFGLFSRLGL